MTAMEIKERIEEILKEYQIEIPEDGMEKLYLFIEEYGWQRWDMGYNTAEMKNS